MAYPQKIATCCYCGTRAALVLRGKTRHELACSSCGAPLHDLKMLPKERTGRRDMSDPPRRAPARPVRRSETPKYRKKSKSVFRKALKEAFDILEDIFD